MTNREDLEAVFAEGPTPGREDISSLSGFQGLDPELLELVETTTRRILDGEAIDLDAMVQQHPLWAETIQGLLPTMRSLVELTEVETDLPKEERDAKGYPVFGNYRIVREVGRGGMGVVYEAEQVPLKRRVALKILPHGVAMDPRALSRFQLESQVAGWLQHPRIVPVYDVGTVRGVPYYAMPFIEGGSLADLIRELRVRVEGRDDPSDPPVSEGVSTIAAGLLSGRLDPLRRESEVVRSASARRPRWVLPRSRNGAGLTRGPWPRSAFRRPRRLLMPMSRGLCIETSSRPTS